jgi:hypothetical protein
MSSNAGSKDDTVPLIWATWKSSTAIEEFLCYCGLDVKSVTIVNGNIRFSDPGSAKKFAETVEFYARSDIWPVRPKRNIARIIGGKIRNFANRKVDRVR